MQVIRHPRIGNPLVSSTSGSVLFADSNGFFAQDNSNFFWNNTSKWLGIGTSPSHSLHVVTNGYGNPCVSINDGYYQYNIGQGSASYVGPNSDFLSIYRQSVTTFFNHKSGGYYFRTNGTDNFYHDGSNLLNAVTGYTGSATNGGGLLLGQNGDWVSNNNEAQFRGNTGKPFVFYVNATIGNLAQSGTEIARFQGSSPQVKFTQTNASYVPINVTMSDGSTAFQVNADKTLQIPAGSPASGGTDTLTWINTNTASQNSELRIKKQYGAQNNGYGAQLALEDAGNSTAPAAYFKYKSNYFIVNRSDLEIHAQVGKIFRMPWNGGIECFTGGAFAVDDQNNVGGVFSIPSYSYLSPGGPPQRATTFSVYTPTFDTSGGTGPISNAASFYIQSAPIIVGSSPTVGTWGVWVDAGISRFDGAIYLFDQSPIRFKDTGSNYAEIKPPTSVTSSYTLTLPTAVGSSGQYLKASDGSGTLAWGSPVSVTEVEIDFGSTPQRSMTFVITDASVSGSSKILPLPSGNPATGRVGNDAEWDNMILSAVAGTGTFSLTAIAVPGPIVGKRKVYYQVV